MDCSNGALNVVFVDDADEDASTLVVVPVDGASVVVFTLAELDVTGLIMDVVISLFTPFVCGGDVVDAELLGPVNDMVKSVFDAVMSRFKLEFDVDVFNAFGTLSSR